MDRRAAITLMVIFGGLFLVFLGFLGLVLSSAPTLKGSATSGARLKLLELEGFIGDAHPLMRQLETARDDEDAHIPTSPQNVGGLLAHPRFVRQD